MAKVHFVLWVSVIAAVAALPSIPIRKLDPERYQYVADDAGIVHLADMWETVADLEEMMRFNPDATLVYHLFTRQNPTISQVLMPYNLHALESSYFNPHRRTIVLLHGWRGAVTSLINRNLTPAFLSMEDVNVIVVDWTAGAGTINYAAAVGNTVAAAQSVARFCTWLNQESGAHPRQYHIAGHSLGGQMSGIVSRHMDRQVSYVTALDPAFPGWITHAHTFQADDALYTESIHTNAGQLGFLTPLGHCSFYPNSGTSMPGCNDFICDHDRPIYYMEESVFSGGFTSRRCDDYREALRGDCGAGGGEREDVRLGGIAPKTGTSGVFWLETNEGPPFSRG